MFPDYSFIFNINMKAIFCRSSYTKLSREANNYISPKYQTIHLTTKIEKDNKPFGLLMPWRHIFKTYAHTYSFVK